jgi:hypothetical protein
MNPYTGRPENYLDSGVPRQRRGAVRVTAAMALARLTAARAESVDACANDTDRAHSFGATEILAISAENLTPTTERNHCSDRKRTQTKGDLSISGGGTHGFWFVFNRGPSSGGNLNIVLFFLANSVKKCDRPSQQIVAELLVNFG